jgi:hypothetical protein
MVTSIEDLKNFCLNKSIIIVGNSQTLIEKNNGKIIDSYDIVVRMNHGYPRNEFKKQMGEKIDIWAVSFLNEELLLHEFKLIQHKIKYLFRANIIKSSYILKSNVNIVMSGGSFYENAQKIVKPHLPSTGFFTFFLFKELCNIEPKLIGFDFFKTSNLKFSSKKDFKHHNFEKEKEFICANYKHCLLEMGD